MTARTTNRPPMTHLDADQMARADALVQARWVVGKDADGSVDAMDVHALARFVLTGEDPWENVRAAVVEDEDWRPLRVVDVDAPEPGDGS